MITTGEFTFISKSYTAENIISLNEIKDRLGIFPVTNTIFDTRLGALRASAVALCEKIINSYILPATIELSLKSFSNIDFPVLPNNYKTNFFIVLKPYIQAINNIKYLDLDKNLITLDVTKYFTEFYKKKVKISSTENSFPVDYYTLSGKGYLGAIKTNLTLGLFNNVNYFKSFTDPLFEENFDAIMIKDAIFQYIQARYESCEENIANEALHSNISSFVFYHNNEDFEL